MKKMISLLVSLAMICSLIPAVYAEGDNYDTGTPPPDLIILEGETWIPDAVDPRTIAPHGGDDECRHGLYPPEDYVFIGAVRGNTTADTTAVDMFTGVIGLFVPAFGVAIAVVGIIEDIFPGDKLEGDYIKLQYKHYFGPDPNLYWFHTHFDFATQRGVPVGPACYATFSPKKSTNNPFQD